MEYSLELHHQKKSLLQRTRKIEATLRAAGARLGTHCGQLRRTAVCTAPWLVLSRNSYSFAPGDACILGHRGYTPLVWVVRSCNIETCSEFVPEFTSEPRAERTRKLIFPRRCCNLACDADTNRNRPLSAGHPSHGTAALHPPAVKPGEVRTYRLVS
jgi:hypothetical protein